ncbi:hypothetical protein D3C78_1970170 [compost metagenome]
MTVMIIQDTKVIITLLVKDTTIQSTMDTIMLLARDMIIPHMMVITMCNRVRQNLP